MPTFIFILFIPFIHSALYAETHVIDIKSEHQAQIISDPTKHKGLLLFNGAYFGIDKKPIGYFKKNGVVSNATVDKKLSGFVTINKSGKLRIIPKDKSGLAPDAPNVFQSGPFIIDKGGKIGIRKSINNRFNRICLLQGKSGWQKVLYYKSIDLFDLAHYIKHAYPDIDMALNLDGGPSCHLQTKTLSIKTTSSMPYFISIR